MKYEINDYVLCLDDLDNKRFFYKSRIVDVQKDKEYSLVDRMSYDTIDKIIETNLEEKVDLNDSFIVSKVSKNFSFKNFDEKYPEYSLWNMK